jgi:hypothetical protein
MRHPRLGLTLEAALQIEGVDCGGMYLADPRTGDLDLAVHHGLSPRFVAQVAHCDAASTRAQAAQAGAPLYTRTKALNCRLTCRSTCRPARPTATTCSRC